MYLGCCKSSEAKIIYFIEVKAEVHTAFRVFL